MSVRKRRWTTVKGEPREAWLVDTRPRGQPLLLRPLSGSETPMLGMLQSRSM